MRLVKPGSAGVEPRDDADENMLLGRVVFLAGCGMKGAAGSASNLSALGRTNIPYPIGQSK